MNRYSPQIHGRWCRKKGHNWRGKEPFKYAGRTYHSDLCLRCHRREDDVPLSVAVTHESDKRRKVAIAAFNDPNPLWARLCEGEIL